MSAAGSGPPAAQSAERTSGAFASSPGSAPPRRRITDAFSRWLRDPDPILLKELRATFRTPGFIRFLYLSTALVGLSVVGGGAMLASGNATPAEAGRNVFQIFFSVLLAVICLVAPGFAATAITSEREAHTYESLILSGMSGTRIVLGKFAAYFASIGLVVVAVAPVVGAAFLFGGISPLAVVVGFAWILMVLAVTTSFGIAVSAHVQVTRAAIVITTLLAVPTSMMLTSTMLGFGEVATSAWGITVGGPFWFADAFAQRVDHFDTWAMLAFAPLYVFGMPTWFFVASAVAGVVPPSDDRSTALKIWGVAAIMLGAIACSLPAYFVAGPTDSGASAVAGAIACVTLLYVVGLALCNEPPLPPATTSRTSWLRRALALIGPGAASTLRFSIGLIVFGAFCICGIACLAHHVGHPSLFWGSAYDEALLAIAVGQACVASCFAALATALRLLLRNGGAARVLACATFAGAFLIALTLTAALDTDAIDRLDHDTAPLLAMTPFGPVMCAGVIAGLRDVGDPRLVDHWIMIGVTSVGYGLLALALWLFVEMRVAGARRMIAARKSALEDKLAAPTRPATVPGPTTPSPSASATESSTQPDTKVEPSSS